MAVGLFLLTNIRPDTPLPLLWLWMLVTGLGIGPAFAVFTLVVQNAVPVRELGRGDLAASPCSSRSAGPWAWPSPARSSDRSSWRRCPSSWEAGLPRRFVGRVRGGRQRSAEQHLTGVGDLGAAILAQVPDAVPAAGGAAHPGHRGRHPRRFSIATGATFVVGVVTALIAAHRGWWTCLADGCGRWPSSAPSPPSRSWSRPPTDRCGRGAAAAVGVGAG